jgi:hypothetical protein
MAQSGVLLQRTDCVAIEGIADIDLAISQLEASFYIRRFRSLHSLDAAADCRR